MHYRPPQSNFRGGHVPRVPRGIYAYASTIASSAYPQKSEYQLQLNISTILSPTPRVVMIVRSRA